MNHLQEELTRPRIHDRDEAIHRLRRHVALERVVHRYTVHVRVVHKPRDLVTEQLVVVLTAQHRLRRFRRVQLQTAADAVTQHAQRRIHLHDLRHRALQHVLRARNVVAETAVHVVREVDADQRARRTRVVRHRV